MGETKKALAQLFCKLKNDKKSVVTLALGFLGIVLMLLSELPSFSSSDNTVEAKQEIYAVSDLCRDVEKLISQVEGAGEVSVMLTYETAGEKIFAKDREAENSADNKRRTSDKYIIVDGDQGENGLIVKEIYPEIRGIAVVCTGGDNPQVRREISVLLSALFDIGSNRISIARRAEKE